MTDKNISIAVESRSVLVDIQNNEIGLKNYGGFKFAAFPKALRIAPERQEAITLDTKLPQLPRTQVAKMKSDIARKVEPQDGLRSILTVLEKAKRRLDKLKSEKDHEDIAMEVDQQEVESNIVVIEESKCELGNSKSVSMLSPDVIVDIDTPSRGLYSYSEYSEDIFVYLRELERELSIDVNLIREQKEITQKARKILVNWILMLQSAMKFKDETLHMTISFIDRYLQRKEVIAINKFQLVGITCIFIAAKYEEGYAPHPNHFVYYTDNTYTKSEILQTEQAILKSLDFRLDRPLALTFLTRYAKASGSSKRVAYMAKYLVEMSLFDSRLSCRSPSLLAAASLFIASKTMDLKFTWNEQLEYYSRYCEDDIMATVLGLCDCYQAFDFDKYPALRKKYLSEKYCDVSADRRLKFATKNILAG